MFKVNNESSSLIEFLNLIEFSLKLAIKKTEQSQMMPLYSPHKKWSFPLRVSSVNVAKSAGNLKKSLMENFIFYLVNTLRLKNKIVMEELKRLHNKFVVVAIGKASGNVAFVCQRHYAQVFINELQ